MLFVGEVTMDTAVLKESLGEIKKPFARLLCAFTAMLCLSLLASEGAHLIGALFIGYLAGGAYLWTLVFRTLRSAGMSAEGAKKEMLFGLVLRFLTLALIFGVAAKVGTQVFAVTVLGFLTVYLTALFLMIGHNLKKGKRG